MIDSPVSSPTITPLVPRPSEKPVDQTQKPAEGTFGEWLKSSLAEVNQLQQEADTSAQQLVAGKSKDIHGTMIAMQKSTIAFQLAMEVRNKVVSAYEEIKRMQF